MVLDRLLSPKRARREPADSFLAALLFVSFGVLVQIFLPSVKGSIIIFAMVPAIPLIWTLLVWEERAEEALADKERARYSVASPLAATERAEYDFFVYHKKLLLVFTWFFLGALAAYAAWYVVLPADVQKTVFAEQVSEIKAIKTAYSGVGQASASGRAFSSDRFNFLFVHNLQVLALMFLFCFVYGIGSIYLLLWNASVIGVVVGQHAVAGGVLGALAGFASLVPHGVFEISAYFVASIAGGILSVTVSRWGKNQRELPFILLDVVTLAIVAMILLAIGAAIESIY